ncbi:MAG: glycosyltransferase family 2 protein [Opitutaceae bacterium]|nr:glycosyltransferase family 2 protein [Cytophagales bacterium]
MLSAVVITNNAKDTIGLCIDALLKVSSDIIVIDSGSDDGTKEICYSKNIRYFFKSWEGYSANKNYGNDLAIHDYILSIDSDEILSDELIKSIKLEFSNMPSADAYNINFITNFCGKWIKYGGWNPEWHIRIFNRKLIKWELLDVHEVLSIKSTYKVKKLTGKVLHYSYPTIQSHLNKIEKYTDLFAERSLKAGKNAGRFKKHMSAGFTFLSNYIIKLGFLDGYYGFVVARNNALYSYLKYKKLSEKRFKN